MKYIVYVWLVALFGFPLTGFTQASALSKKLLKTKNLVALWDFKEAEGQPRTSLQGQFDLAETNGHVPRISEGPLSGFSAQFGAGSYLSLANEKRGVKYLWG